MHVRRLAVALSVLAAAATTGVTREARAAAAVALCRDGTEGSCTLLCTGALITPNLVLTARHCALDDITPVECGRSVTTAPLAPAEFFVTAASPASTPFAKRLRGRAWTLATTPSPCGHDLALLELDGAFGETPTMDPFLQRDDRATTFALDIFQSRTAAGPERVRLDGIALACRGGSDECSAFKGELGTNELLTNQDVCPGASGAGLASPDSNKVFGVLSRIASRTSNDCGAGIYTLIDSHALLVARAARKAAASLGAPPAEWVSRLEAIGNDATLPPRSDGAPCDSPEDCPSGSSCLTLGAHQICTRPCEGGCPTEMSCSDTVHDGVAWCDRSTRVPRSKDPGGCAVPTTASPTSAAWQGALLAVLGAAVLAGRKRYSRVTSRDVRSKP